MSTPSDWFGGDPRSEGLPERFEGAQLWAPSASLRVYANVLSEPTGLHWHDFHELTFVVGGDGTHVCNETVRPVGRGSLFLLTPADIHQLIPAPETAIDHFNVIFSGELLDDELRQLLHPSHCHDLIFSGNECAALESEFRRMWSEFSCTLPGRGILLRGTLERILVIMVRAAEQQDPTGQPAGEAQSQPIRKALAYLHDHFRQPVTLAAVAGQIGYSATYLSERFRQETGETFQAYLQALRLRFAASLLAATDVSITQVCHAAGFRSLPHFDRAFKKRHGCSPTSYRRAGK